MWFYFGREFLLVDTYSLNEIRRRRVSLKTRAINISLRICPSLRVDVHKILFEQAGLPALFGCSSRI
jgi:hypothetical protein